MTIFDLFILAILAVSAVVAASQGFLREVFGLAGLVIGLWIALWNYRVVAASLSHAIRSQAVCDVLGFLLIALGIMVLFGLLGRLFSSFARGVGLGGLDRLLGAIFGIVRGGVLVVVMIVAIAAFFPQNTCMKGSKLAPYFLTAANQVSAGAPAELRLKIQEGVAALEQVRPIRLQFGLHPHPETR